MWNHLKGKKLAGISVLFAILLNYPIISIFSQSGYIWGVPRLYASIFMMWLLMIILLILLLETRDTSRRSS
ncbi:MAG: hypothetical protein SF053_22085 [Bacteroidia bacterium]|nr:hypothetical protein [Bacteroidia bacterium]